MFVLCTCIIGLISIAPHVNGGRQLNRAIKIDTISDNYFVSSLPCKLNKVRKGYSPVDLG